MNTKGKCYGVSVGPGDKRMITLEALEVIKSADIIFLPTSPKDDCTAYKIVKEMWPEIDEKELRCETFTMSRDAALLKQRHKEIYDVAKQLLDEGKIIAFLALGEVALFSTYVYIHELLEEGGYESQFVAGISSVQAVAAKLGIPLASGKEDMHIFSSSENLKQKLSVPGTKIFMKTRKNLDELTAGIAAYVNEHPGSMAAGVSNCGMEGEIVAASAEELSMLTGYFTVIIVKDAPDVEEPYAADYSYFENRSCKYYPCHKSEHLNCLFCYCPMYALEHCPGNPRYKEKDGRCIKVCTDCTFPHEKENYTKVMGVLKKIVENITHIE